MGNCSGNNEKQSQPVPKGKKRQRTRFRRKLKNGKEVLEETFCDTFLDQSFVEVDPNFRYPIIRGTAPTIQAESVVRGKEVPFKLQDQIGKWVVILFYPHKNDISDKEVKQFEDNSKKFKNANAELLFIVTPEVKSKQEEQEEQEEQNKKKEENQLGQGDIPLITDKKKDISTRYVVLDQNSKMALKSNYIIDDDGIVRHYNINDDLIGTDVDELYELLLALQKSKDEDPYAILFQNKITVYDMLLSKHKQGIDIWEMGDEANKKYWKLIIQEFEEDMNPEDFKKMSEENKLQESEEKFWVYVEEITGRKRKVEEAEESPAWKFGAYEDEAELENELRAKGEISDEGEEEEDDEE